MVFIAILNGAIRRFGYGKWLNEVPAHQLSTGTAIVLFGLYILFVSFRWPLQSSYQEAE